MSSYSIVKPSTAPPRSSMAILMPFTMLVVCALALPVRGRLLTIFSVFPAESCAGAAARRNAAPVSAATMDAVRRIMARNHSEPFPNKRRRSAAEGPVCPDNRYDPPLTPKGITRT